MTTFTDIANRALQIPGTRTTVTTAELNANSSNEAIQINLVANTIRRSLLRMAPWSGATKTVNLTYITSAPGTPENTSAATTLWQLGQPRPPWAYEYQYPVDCLRMGWLIPATQTGFAGGIPITTAVTGGAASFWQGPPVKFEIGTDTFVPVTAASPVAGGTGYAIGDYITLAAGLSTNPPIGAPAILQVTGIGVGGAVTSVNVISQVPSETAPFGGSYFAQQTNPVAQGSTTGAGTGATFNLTYAAPGQQRVILTNQEFATAVYIGDVTDYNVIDDQFQDAFAKILGATITIPLTGDKKLANLAIQQANNIIALARVGDANDGFTVNDTTPDWLRIRGLNSVSPYSGPYTGFDWSGQWPIYG